MLYLQHKKLIVCPEIEKPVGRTIEIEKPVGRRTIDKIRSVS